MDHASSQEGLREEQPPLKQSKNELPNLIEGNSAQESVSAQHLETGQATTSSSPTPLPTIPSATVIQADDIAPGGASSQSLADGTVIPAIADDADLIEKEWVMRAKHIVQQTRQDPHTQNQEVNKIKAEYLKKRYNKDVKLT